MNWLHIHIPEHLPDWELTLLLFVGVFVGLLVTILPAAYLHTRSLENEGEGNAGIGVVIFGMIVCGLVMLFIRRNAPNADDDLFSDVIAVAVIQIGAGLVSILAAILNTWFGVLLLGIIEYSLISGALHR